MASLGFLEEGGIRARCKVCNAFAIAFAESAALLKSGCRSTSTFPPGVNVEVMCTSL